MSEGKELMNGGKGDKMTTKKDEIDNKNVLDDTAEKERRVVSFKIQQKGRKPLANGLSGEEIIERFITDGWVAGKHIISQENPLFLERKIVYTSPGLAEQLLERTYNQAVVSQTAEALLEAEGDIVENVAQAIQEMPVEGLLEEILRRRENLFARLGRRIGWGEVLKEYKWSIVNREKPCLRKGWSTRGAQFISRDESGKWVMHDYIPTLGPFEDKHKIKKVPAPLTPEILDEIFAK